MNLQPHPGAPDGFPFEANHVRAQLGLNKEEARALRKTALKTTDWLRAKKRVFLSADAAQRLWRATKGPLPEKAPPARPGSTGDASDPVPTEVPKKPAPEHGPVTLTVVRCDLANRRLLLCCPAGEDPGRPKRTVRVRVHHTDNFRVGMELPAVLVAGYADLYDIARNLPRQKGKW